MNKLLIASILIAAFASGNAADQLPEARNIDIEYASPRAAYEALRKKDGVVFSKDDSGWIVAFDKTSAIIWSFAPDQTFPVVVKRTLIERDGHLFIAMDVLCRGAKEACDDVVRRYTSINEQLARDAQQKREAK